MLNNKCIRQTVDDRNPNCYRVFRVRKKGKDMLKEEYIISFGQEVPADTACSRNKDRFDMAKTWVIWE